MGFLRYSGSPTGNVERVGWDKPQIDPINVAMLPGQMWVKGRLQGESKGCCWNYPNEFLRLDQVEMRRLQSILVLSCK